MTRLSRESAPWVIFAWPQQHPTGPGANRFIARNGTVTESEDQAAHFATYDEAVEFARAKKIPLDRAVPYIGQIWRRLSRHRRSG